MFACLENVVSQGRLKALQKLMADSVNFESGAETAGSEARKVKFNRQAVNDSPETQAIIGKLRQDLNDHPAFRRIAMPAKFGRLMLNRYEEGMAYGTHFDEAIIGGARTDVSFTLFLSEPDSYEGGELEIVTSTGAQAIKLPAGCAVVYPGDRLHRVRPVSHGHRDACVGWVQSRIRSAEDRELLADLAEAINTLASADGDEAALLGLRHVRNRLIRRWSEL
ncbi:MAG: Fe2+-dependent dioxygenase [Pseudomonadota bacterium]